MNTLSWLIYLAGVSQSLKILAGICIIGGIALNIIIAIRNSIAASDDYIYDRKIKTTPWNHSFKVILIPLIFLTISCFIPDTKTVTLIAASEIGNKVVMSDKTQQIVDPGLDYIKTWLNKQTQDLKKEIK